MCKKVSVIVPIYNGEKHIRNCLNSLLKQKLDDYEIICINDGSSDNSVKIVEEYAAIATEKIQVINQPNQGTWFARITGISFARGEYICFCDIDDIVTENWLSDMYNAIISTNADMAVCGFARIDSKTNKILSEEMSKSDCIFDLKEDNSILLTINTSLWNKMIKKSLIIHHIKLDKALKIGEDAILLYSIYPLFKKIVFISAINYYYKVTNTSAISNFVPSDFYDIQDAYLKLKDFYNNSNNTNLTSLLDILALLHCEIINIIKLDSNCKCNLNSIYSQSILYMDTNFTNWRNSDYLKLKNVLKNPFLFKIFVCKILCTTNLFILFVKIYNYLTNKFNFEIKW
ncbi:MAG: glycosyl transferase family 2 protein [Clostridiaceae bacterium]|jgi:glycosyltransferase involved in cell wall biosynthesis|nr:glycosyl transferase family 2 protein [Clostridiaceae bacterium]